MTLASKPAVALLAAAWILSLVAVAVLFSVLPSRNALPPANAPGVLPSKPSTDEVTVLRAENERLQHELDEINLARNQLSRDYLQLVLEHTLSNAMHGDAPQDAIAETWKSSMSGIESKQGEMLGGLEETVSLLVDMAAYGEAGITWMANVANNATRPDTERILALHVLARMQSPQAFRALVRFRDEDLMELEFPYDLITEHVRRLSTSAIMPEVPQLITHLNNELGADNYSPERPEVLVYLALTHRIPEARQLLRDPRMNQENVSEALEAAAGMHSPEARAYIEGIAANHAQEHYRVNAQQILEAW